MTRTHTDGKPYYCDTCGCGYGEYMACEEVDCKLESEADAQQRIVSHQNNPLSEILRDALRKNES